MPLYVVDTLVSVRKRYVIEADELEHAYDEVTFRSSGNPKDDFSPLVSLDLGETVMDGREIDEAELQRLTSASTNKYETSYVGNGFEVRKINYDT